MSRFSRIAYGNLLESIDAMDATNSREQLPSYRLEQRHARRRDFGTCVCCVLILAALVVACI